MTLTEIIAKYGGADLALQRYATLATAGRGLTPEEAVELADLTPHAPELQNVISRLEPTKLPDHPAPPPHPSRAPAPISAAPPAAAPAQVIVPALTPINAPPVPAPINPAPTPPVPAPIVRKTPLEWWQTTRINNHWNLICLAATMLGWDHTCEDLPEITEAEYLAALEAARDKLAEVRTSARTLPDSTSANRVYIQRHPTGMGAVIAHKPAPGECGRILNLLTDNDVPMELRQSQIMQEFWSRVLWPPAPTPKEPSPAITKILNEDPAGYALGYPGSFISSVGIRGTDVRGK